MAVVVLMARTAAPCGAHRVYLVPRALAAVSGCTQPCALYVFQDLVVVVFTLAASCQTTLSACMYMNHARSMYSSSDSQTARTGNKGFPNMDLEG